MNRPRILLTCDRAVVGDPPRLADLVNAAYVEAVERAGGLPMLVPCGDTRRLTEALDWADGVLLTGGRDYPTAGLHPTADYCHPHRERRDLALWPLLVDRRHAVLGICLGMQLMALGAGGILYQDIDSQAPGVHPHRARRHVVILASDSRLGGMLGRRITVNSSHHQAIRRPPAVFTMVGWASDGIIEAMELPGERFVVGVQWHPERMARSTAQERLFVAFVRASANGGHWA